jgi:hypothetical protein
MYVRNINLVDQVTVSCLKITSRQSVGHSVSFSVYVWFLGAWYKSDAPQVKYTHFVRLN